MLYIGSCFCSWLWLYIIIISSSSSSSSSSLLPDAYRHRHPRASHHIDHYGYRYLWLLVTVSIPVAMVSRLIKSEGRQAFLKTLNVRATKVVRAAQEIERKTFHVSGVLVPLWCVMQSIGSEPHLCIL